MAYPESSFLVWSFGLIQFLGLTSVWLARLSEGSRQQASGQRLFLGCLALIGLATMVSVALGPRYWLVSGTTLSVMVLGAIWDFRPEARPDSLYAPPCWLACLRQVPAPGLLLALSASASSRAGLANTVKIGKKLPFDTIGNRHLLSGELPVALGHTATSHPGSVSGSGKVIAELPALR